MRHEGPTLRYRDRADAGGQLAPRIAELRLERPVVLGLPRGGIPVAKVIAAALGAPLEVFVACKVGLPGHKEMGIGAVAEGLSHPIGLDPDALGLDDGARRRLIETACAELDRRVALYRGNRPLPELRGADLVLVDDGLATGVTAEAALRALRQRAPRRLVLAIPVCAPQTFGRLHEVADDVVCGHIPEELHAVSLWYDDFRQTPDAEVLALLAPTATGRQRHDRPARSEAAAMVGPSSSTGRGHRSPSRWESPTGALRAG